MLWYNMIIYTCYGISKQDQSTWIDSLSSYIKTVTERIAEIRNKVSKVNFLNKIQFAII